jgi:DNA-binding FadR family transcriptional regulator
MSKQNTVYKDAYNRCLRLIEAGGRLASEPELGTALGVSRTTVYDVIAMIFHYHYQWNKTNEVQRNAIAATEHLNYIAALKSGDLAEVEKACHRHLQSARETLLQSIPEGWA